MDDIAGRAHVGVAAIAWSHPFRQIFATFSDRIQDDLARREMMAWAFVARSKSDGAAAAI
ncbi:MULTISPECIES: hypothetical protein [Bradyrhizobium]|uniref:hypothetical protein n=1 Tax=Bradyrhizobium TaxID=374 RepID=UPI0004B7A104|nr:MULTISPECIES: hypothetical protein [Bradyrhizobium]MCS3564720.1 hypothetical protein [Bradyrhizobium elkanii]MDI2057419.1 hypothetical protein [Bradyrhizobium sp. Mp19]WLC08974.1 hypothetical protein QIH86_05530 [Bradyrhizobium elkanii USDA 94]